jgi:hypothetical protein
MALLLYEDNVRTSKETPASPVAGMALLLCIDDVRTSQETPASPVAGMTSLLFDVRTSQETPASPVAGMTSLLCLMFVLHRKHLQVLLQGWLYFFYS